MLRQICGLPVKGATDKCSVVIYDVPAALLFIRSFTHNRFVVQNAAFYTKK